MSHRKTDLGIPAAQKSAKVVLGRVLINFGKRGSLNVRFAPKATEFLRRRERRDGPITGSCSAISCVIWWHWLLIDHLVGAAEKHRWDFESKRLKSMFAPGERML
jgi:hypothetical protein